MHADRFSVVEGPPGAGKTTVLREIQRQLESSRQHHAGGHCPTKAWLWVAPTRDLKAETEQKKAQEVGEEETQEEDTQGARQEEKEEAYAEASEAAETEAADAMPSASLEDVMALLQQAEGHTVAVGRLKKPQGPSGLTVAVEELTTQEVASQHKLHSREQHLGQCS